MGLKVYNRFIIDRPIVEIPTANMAGFLSKARSKKVSPDGQPEMIDQTGNTYITETLTDRIEVPTANLGSATLYSSTKCQQK